MSATHVYIRPAPGQQYVGDGPSARAVKRWLEQRGITTEASQQGSGGVRAQWHIESDLRRPTRVESRAVGAAMLRAIQPGDVLVVARLDELVDFPGNARLLLRLLASRDVELRVLDVDMSGQDVVRALQVTGAAFSGLDDEIERLQAVIDGQQANADARVEHAVTQAVQALIANKEALRAFFLGLPQGAGDVSKPIAGGELSEKLAAWRKEAGMTQKQLAEAVGLSQPDIAHLERGSKSYGLMKVIEYFETQRTPHAPLNGTGGEHAAAA